MRGHRTSKRNYRVSNALFHYSITPVLHLLRENMPTVGRQIDHGFLSNSEVRVSSELCKQGYTVNFYFKQGSIAEIVFTRDVSRQACSRPISRVDFHVFRSDRQGYGTCH